MYEICTQIATADKFLNDTEQEVPYLVKDDQWMGFDDESSLRIKVIKYSDVYV